MTSNLVRTLDPSSSGPLLTGTVRIPSNELPSRVHELPAPAVPLHVVIGPGFDKANEFLETTRRQVIGVQPPPIAPVQEHNRLWEPPAFLEEVELGPPGQALSIGCGTGREAVWLAERGWQVTAIDRLPDALELGKRLERCYPGPHPINWLCLDVKKEPLPQNPVDLIVQFLFFHAPLLDQFAPLLSPGGLVILETFSPANRDRFGKPDLNLVLPLDQEISGLESIFRAHQETSAKCTTRLVARKPQSS